MHVGVHSGAGAGALQALLSAQKVPPTAACVVEAAGTTGIPIPIYITMASLIPPKRPHKAGTPKLSLQLGSPDDRLFGSDEKGGGDVTIMPALPPGMLDESDHKEELRRAVHARKESHYEEYLMRLSRSQIDTQRGGSEDVSLKDIPLDDASEMQLEGNLEILQHLGDGASGTVSKARIISTGIVIARKVSFC